MIEGGSTVYKVVDPNTILNVYYTADYDGNGTPAFVVVGNPLVLSSSTYSIYANGYNDFVNNCELSDFEDVAVTTSNQTANYDGYMTFNVSGVSSSSIYINDIDFFYYLSPSSSYSVGQVITFPINKGDTYRMSTPSHLRRCKCRWYKKRDYSNR